MSSGVQILDVDESEVTLDIYAQERNGDKKFDIITATVRVYYVSGGSETVVRSAVSLTQVGATNVWRYSWFPTSLPARIYTAEYTLVDSNGITLVEPETLVVREATSQADVQAAMTAQGYTTARAPNLDNLDATITGIPTAVDVVLTGAHGSGSWKGEGGLEFQASMSDDEATLTFAVWQDLDGTRRTDLTSMSAKIKSPDDTTIHDFGSTSTQTSDGIFKFTVTHATLSTPVAVNYPYVLAVRAVKSGDPDSPWDANLGFVKVRS